MSSRVPLSSAVEALFCTRNDSLVMESGLLSKTVAAPDSSGEEMKMIQRIVPSKHIGRILTCFTFLVCYHEALVAQNDPGADTQASGSRLHLTHILGFEGMSKNTNGDLAIQDGYLRFQKNENSSGQIPVGSIRDLTLGEQNRQVGGIPMMLAKSAAPYGAGRVISLFSHKKYETVTLEYVDAKGGLHGAIFQLKKGEAQVLRNELETAGAHITRLVDETAKGSTPGDQE
jgi:hypothetical protein